MAKKSWVLAAVACGTFMATLDSSIVNIALPTLTKELGPDLPHVKWVVVSYLLAITALLLPFGRLSDLYGRKKIFRLGFLVFILGSALCGTSSTLDFLIFSRVIQAMGAAMLMANGPAIITSVFPLHERGKALGNLAMVVSAGLIMGPGLGGFLIGMVGWKSIFLVNIPVGILGMYLVEKNLDSTDSIESQVGFDWVGAGLQSAFLIAMVMLFDPPELSIGKALPFSSQRIWVTFLAFLVLILFIRVESRVRFPLFDLSLLKNRTFWAGNLAAFLLFVSYSAVTVLMPFYMEGALRLSARESGLLMTAIPITILFIAPIAGRLSDHIGSKGLSIAGASTLTAGLFFMSGGWGPGLHDSISHMLLAMGLSSMGAALGLFQSPNNSAIMSSVVPEKLGVASAFLATIRNLGWVTGTGLSTTVFAWRFDITDEFLPSLHFTLGCAGVCALLSVCASLLKRKN